jgi:hypothetical protein
VQGLWAASFRGTVIVAGRSTQALEVNETASRDLTKGSTRKPNPSR